jgi:hypothetical protein
VAICRWNSPDCSNLASANAEPGSGKFMPGAEPEQRAEASKSPGLRDYDSLAWPCGARRGRLDARDGARPARVGRQKPTPPRVSA